ncbi:hypothetical protein ESA94_19470 [Lacibacter luteus]|uniref:Uncharacterized protein n=1 Tax=Lacibacter luteus TaxID=2508719 RepID=A0A4Q1CDH0_9BACT|nr:hypothetical protein [Lacibacter luteus]RXK57707.1 hypothetical protein ESA94_19470 [Lacibacter luteus]
MLNLMLYGMIALFMFFYLLRALLMAGYERLNAKHDKNRPVSFGNRFLSIVLKLKPLLQSRLRAVSIDQKKHLVFQQKATVYYYLLWLTLFAILFLTAKIYLNAF